MSIELSYLDNDLIVVIHMQKHHTVKDFIEVINDKLIPHARKLEPTTVHLITDWSEVDWSFPDLVTYLTSTAERRKNSNPPRNGRYHYVGTKPWINAWRTYMLKNYGIETGSFETLDDALTYIRANYKPEGK